MRRIFRNILTRSACGRKANIVRRLKPNQARLNLSHMESRIVPTVTYAVTVNSPDDGTTAGTLRKAIADAGADGDDSVIDFQFAGATTITLALGQIQMLEDTGGVGKTLEFKRTGAGSVTVDGNNAGGIFFVDASYTGATFKMSDFTMTKGKTGGDGGALLVNAAATVSTLTNINMTNCEADNAAGGAAAFAFSTTLTNCQITGNKIVAAPAVTYPVGGGLAVLGGSVTITNCNISGNTITNVATAGYYAAGVGAFIGGTHTDLTVSGSTISGNVSKIAGRGIGTGLNAQNATYTNTLNISNSTISGNLGGLTGGGLYTTAQMATISNTQVNGNSATGNGGALRFGSSTAATITMSDCTVDGNSGGSAGGAVWRSTVNATDTFNFNRCTFSNNISGNSGGVFSTNGAGTGTVNFVNSTFFNNVCAGNGGVVRTFTSFNGTINVRNCTVVGNVAPTQGGGFNIGGVAGSKLNIESTVFFNNKAGGATTNQFADVQTIAGNTITINNSYLSVGVPTGFTFTGASNKFGTAAVPINPNLETSLSNHGGTTKTLLPLSTAVDIINKGSNSLGLLTDQRNDNVVFPRSFSGGVDIGATEFNNPVPTVTALVAADVTAAGASTYQFTVTFTTTVAGQNIDASTLGAVGGVTVSGGGFGSPVNATLVGSYSNAPSIAVTYQITPPGGTWDFADNGTYTINIGSNKIFSTPVVLAVPNGPVGTFKCAIGATIVVNTFSIDESVDTDGKTSLREAINLANTSAFAGKDTITFDPTVFTGPTPEVISLDGSLKTITISDSLVISGPNEHVQVDGSIAAARLFQIGGPGTLNVSFDKMDFSNGLQTDNAFGSNGGAVRIADENVTFTNCNFNNNANLLDGGAIGQNGIGNLVVTNCTFVSNFSTGGGGGAIAMVAGGTLTVSGSTFGGAGTGNNVTGNGGAINAQGLTTITVTNSTFQENVSTGAGIVAAGGLFSNGNTTINITGSKFIGNSGTDTTSGSVAGGIGIIGNATVTIDTSTFKGNFTNSGNGGAIWSRNDSVPTITITNSTISGNTAGGAVTTGSGGGISMNGGGTLNVINSTIANNVAATDGGGIDASGITTPNTNMIVNIRNSTIAFNTATGGAVGGGGIAMHTIGTGGGLTVSSSVIAKNTGTTSADVNADAAFIATSKNAWIGDTTGSVVTYSVAPLTGDPSFDPVGLTNNGGPTETIAILGTSGLKNAGNNDAALAFDQRGATFNRNSGGGTDIGAFEIQSAAAPPTVLSVVINGANGAGAQRSMIESIVITFSEAVNFTGVAFQLARTANAANNPGGLLGNVNLTVVETSPSATVTLKFTTGGTVGVDPAGVGKFSLLDGQYQLTIFASGITGTGGNMAANFTTPTAGSSRIFRLYGDADGNGIVDGLDFGAFRTAFNTNSFTFDKDGSGVVDGLDFGSFRNEFNNSVP